MRAGNADVAGVEKDHEHPAVCIGRQRVRLGRRLRVDACVLGAARGDDDVLERFDLLRDAVLGDLKSAAVEVLDRYAVLGGIDVDPDEVRSGLERVGPAADCCGSATTRTPERVRNRAKPRRRTARCVGMDTSDLRGKLAPSVYRSSRIRADQPALAGS